MSRTRPYAKGCPLEAATQVIGGKWKSRILFHLLEGPVRFNELRRLVPQATQRMLTLQLRELEQDGVVHREEYPEVPPKVEYSLTALGRELKSTLVTMKDWGTTYVRSTEADAARAIQHLGTVERSHL